MVQASTDLAASNEQLKTRVADLEQLVAGLATVCQKFIDDDGTLHEALAEEFEKLMDAGSTETHREAPGAAAPAAAAAVSATAGAALPAGVAASAEETELAASERAPYWRTLSRRACQTSATACAAWRRAGARAALAATPAAATPGAATPAAATPAAASWRSRPPAWCSTPPTRHLSTQRWVS